MAPPKFPLRLTQAFSLVLVAGLLAGCAAGPSGEDRFETPNRAVHGFNKGLDTVILRPASQAYGTVVPDVVRQGVSNVASNVSLPGDVVNHTLQGEFRSAANMTGRFLVNSTFGVLGLFDIAGPAGVPEDDTDFGETLHVWGAGEGAYVELPLLGPSTSRDAVGTVVDTILNPIGAVIETPESTYVAASRTGSLLDGRYRFTNTIDSVLYDSADSYAQSRLVYLQNRRFELGDDTTTPAASSGAGGDDLYDDLYFE
ncbi:MAG: VacJ family lipoprotein [Pseudomonadota bacterium]